MPPSVDLSRATQGRWVDAAIYEMASSVESVNVIVSDDRDQRIELTALPGSECGGSCRRGISQGAVPIEKSK